MISISIRFFLALALFWFQPLKAIEKTLASASDKENLVEDTKVLQIPEGYRKNLRWNLVLDSVGKNGSLIRWMSGNPKYISHEGRLLKQSPRGRKKVKVKMTALLSNGKERNKKSFDIYIAYEEPKYDAYLFAYFEGSVSKEKNEQFRFGVSEDAVNWFALNNNEPILSSEKVSGTGGIRDPHILRGEDEKTFYMVATDMYVGKNGWGANPGIVMLRSDNLLDWKHNYIHLEKLYPQKFANVQWLWAPQTIYDPAAGKYLVYFTVRYKNDGKLDFYSAYANKDFSGFENEPKLMFSAKYGAIDGDIVYKDGIYHFFFKGNTKDEQGKEVKNGIKQAFGKTLQGPWVEDYKYLDVYAGTKTHVEGSSVFKVNNSDTYILMYDLYSSRRYEFQRSTDLYKFTEKPESFTKNFFPRHGSVISITREEAQRLNQKWGGVPQSLLTNQIKD